MKPFAGILFALCCAAPVCPQGPPSSEQARQLQYTRAHYTKYDYRIPMRDGVRLFTSVYIPKDHSQAYPFLMERTPYPIGPYGIDNYRPVVGQSESFEREGFIFVYQNSRGRYLSEGAELDPPQQGLKQDHFRLESPGEYACRA